MSRQLILYACWGFIAWLFRQDMAWRKLGSKALLIPGAFIAIQGSRPVSYWFGYRYKEHVAELWPLSRYPEILPRGEEFVKKWGVPSIFIGRFFGPLRASVPLAAGIFEMSYWPFQIANFISALVWSAALLLVGDVMGKLAEWLWRAA